MNDSSEFLQQFVWEPTIVGQAFAPSRAVVGGMGGSHLAADLLASAAPALGLATHHDYGLPLIEEGAMAIAVSHSGTTEETLDFAQAAHAKGVPMAAVSTGGKLIEFAVARNIAHIVLPQTGLEPRACVGYHAVALLTLMGRTQELGLLRAAAKAPGASHEGLAARLAGGAPLIYSSQKNAAIAQYIKVQINETAKMPAFINTFPELNHNEMTATLCDKASRAVMLRDAGDHPRVLARMDAIAAIAGERGIMVEIIELPAEPYERLVAGVVLGQELSRALAALRGADPDDSSIIEDFKKRIA
jgi:glucose/mannose-6-phosphate isomerase